MQPEAPEPSAEPANPHPNVVVMRPGTPCSEIPGYACVAERLCDRDGEIITDHRNLFTLRQASGFSEPETEINTQAAGSKCPRVFEVCCKDNGIKPEDDGVPGAGGRTRPTSRCGTHNVNGVEFRIENGNGNGNGEEIPTQFGEWPFMCLIYKGVNTLTFDEFECGATLLTPGVVLTAAHCVNETGVDYLVRCGDWDLKSDQEPLRRQDQFAERVTVHPSFNPITVHNDVALLHLQRDAVHSKF